jgi:hypothetical protein
MRLGDPLFASAVFLFSLAASNPAARAEPAMFSASFIMHAFGNDVTTGTAPPFSTSIFTALPLGRDCQHSTPHTPSDPRYCSQAVIEVGHPATGSSTLAAGTTTPASLHVPQSALGITTTAFLPKPYPYSVYQSNTYATLVNAAGRFFVAGGAAAGLGQKTKTGMGRQAGTWVIHEGANAFGGIMGLLGQVGARREYLVPGVPGSYVGTGSWNMVRALGRAPYATATEFTPMGKASNWLNPHRVSNIYVNSYNGKQSTLVLRGSGTPWTTGSVTLYATAGVFTTILHRAGYDSTTPSGARNLQLVTPALTHWIGTGSQTHTGHIGILKLSIAPEPGAVLLLAAGLGCLAALYRVRGQW